MNREIKFRVFDKEKNDFINDLSNFWITPDFKWLGCQLPAIDFAAHDLSDFRKRYVFQQYTGLEDSNGKEIYEGDILEITQEPDFCHEPDKWYGFYGVVEFDYKSAGFRVQKYEDFGSSKKDGDSDDFYYLDRIFRTVIGNIFENPELLK